MGEKLGLFGVELEVASDEANAIGGLGDAAALFVLSHPLGKLRAEAVEVAGLRAFLALSDGVGVLAAPLGFDGVGRFFTVEFEQAVGDFFWIALTRLRSSSLVMLAVKNDPVKSRLGADSFASIPLKALHHTAGHDEVRKSRRHRIQAAILFEDALFAIPVKRHRSIHGNGPRLESQADTGFNGDSAAWPAEAAAATHEIVNRHAVDASGQAQRQGVLGPNQILESATAEVAVGDGKSPTNVAVGEYFSSGVRV